MTKTNSTRAVLIFRVMVFVAIHVATFAAILKIEWIPSFQMAILVMPAAIYLTIFFIEAKSRINKGSPYEEVWRGCFWFSFWAGAVAFGVEP